MHNLMTPDYVIADVTPIINDEGMQRYSHGWYLSQIQQALEELAYDTRFDKKEWTGVIPADRILEMPADFWTEDAVFLYDGDDCHAGNITNVYYARGFSNYKGATMKMQRGVTNDPIMGNTTHHANDLHFYSRVNGNMHFSQACAGRKVFIKYRGSGTPIGETPMVPQEFRQAVKNYVTINALTAMLHEDFNKWNPILLTIKGDQFGGRYGHMDDGAWLKAKRRANAISQKQSRDLATYMGNHILKQ